MFAIGLRTEISNQVKERFQVQTLPLLSALPTSAIDDIVIVDSQSVDTAELIDFITARPELGITYVVDEVDQTMTAFSAAQGIRVVTKGDLISFLEGEKKEQNQKPVLAFWGVNPRLGTTTIALTLAHTLATEHDKSVGVIGLNAYNPGQWLLKKHTHYVNSLLSFLRRKALDADQLRSSMEKTHNFCYLLGPTNQTEALVYKPEDISYLIDVAKSIFDVVILDVGSVLNTALALQGLLMATQRYVVADDLLSTKDTFLDHLDYAIKPLGLGTSDFMLVGNQLHNPKMQTLAKSMNLTPITGIPYLQLIGYYAEQQSDPMKMFLEEKQFKKGIDAIALSVMSILNPDAPKLAVAR